MDTTAPVCAYASCTDQARVRGWCPSHYLRWWRYGDPAPRRQPQSLADRFWAKVEKTETCWLWTGALHTGYGWFSVSRTKQVLAHRLAYELLVGPIPCGLDLDHVCHQRACVNPDHLRPVTAKQNNENRLGATARKSKGARGVFWRENAQKWIVIVGHNGHQVTGGSFTDHGDAEQAAIALRNRLFTHNDADRGLPIDRQGCL